MTRQSCLASASVAALRAGVSALRAGVSAILLSACVVAAQTAIAAPQRITAAGVGAIKLGALYSTLHAKGLLGPMTPGCELAGPNTKAASLRPPLDGSVDLSLSEPRKVTTITIRGGATARGVGVGSTARALKAAFPSAKFDHSSDKVFESTFVTVGRKGGGPISFSVGVKSQRVQQIAVPNLAVCE